MLSDCPQVLENENQKLKGHLKVLLDKAATDDQLVDALREESQTLRERISKQAAGMSPTGRVGDGGADTERVARMAVDQVSAATAAMPSGDDCSVGQLQ